MNGNLRYERVFHLKYIIEVKTHETLFSMIFQHTKIIWEIKKIISIIHHISTLNVLCGKPQLAAKQ